MCAATDSANTCDSNSQFANYPKSLISAKNEARTLPEFEQQHYLNIEEQ